MTFAEEIQKQTGLPGKIARKLVLLVADRSPGDISGLVDFEDEVCELLRGVPGASAQFAYRVCCSKPEHLPGYRVILSLSGPGGQMRPDRDY